MKCCHHSQYGTVHLYAKFGVDIIFLQYLFMNFQCQNNVQNSIQNTCLGRIQSIKVGALDATANSLWIIVLLYVYLIKLVKDKLLENG